MKGTIDILNENYWADRNSDDVSEEISYEFIESILDYISKKEGVSIEETPYSFILRNVGINTLNLDITIMHSPIC